VALKDENIIRHYYGLGSCILARSSEAEIKYEQEDTYDPCDQLNCITG